MTTLRLPLAFTAIFALVVVALAFVSSTDQIWSTIAGYVVFVFTAIVIYVLAGAMSLATGGPAMNLGKPIQK